MQAMSLAFDEFGRPFVIMKDEENQSRLTGTDAIKSHIIAARWVSSFTYFVVVLLYWLNV